MDFGFLGAVVVPTENLFKSSFALVVNAIAEAAIAFLSDLLASDLFFLINFWSVSSAEKNRFEHPFLVPSALARRLLGFVVVVVPKKP
jgi:hypothetical protein